MFMSFTSTPLSSVTKQKGIDDNGCAEGDRG